MFNNNDVSVKQQKQNRIQLTVLGMYLEEESEK